MPRFVIVVDAQRDFMMPDGALYVAGADALVAPIDRWLARLDETETAGVLFTCDTHDAATYALSPEAAEFPLHCVRGSAGWRSVLTIDGVDPAIPCYALEKGVFDMWAEPGLPMKRIGSGGTSDRDAFFATLRASGVDEVVVAGVAADYCVRWAVEGLVARRFRVTVPASLTRGISRQSESVAADEWSCRAVTIVQEA